MRLLAVRFLVITALVASALACDKAPTTPTSSTPTPTVTETFTGTLNTNGAITHNFVSATFGTVTSTLTVLSPDSVVIGMALGTWNGIACNVIIAADKSGINTTVTGSVSTAGNLCVRLYDVGNVKPSASYEVQVIHP